MNYSATCITQDVALHPVIILSDAELLTELFWTFWNGIETLKL